MASSIQLLRSTNPQERPFAGNLLEGQPAANLHSSEPGLFFKTTDGSVVKFGPAAITSDGSPPNSAPQGSAGNSVGELWLDKSVDPAILKVYDGSQWIDAGSGGDGGASSFVRWIYTAIGGETSLSGSSGGVLLQYVPGLEEVFVNGVLVTRGVDYSAVTGSSVTNLQPLAAGDVVTVTSYIPDQIVQLPGQITLLRWTVTASQGQTVLSGTDSSGQTLVYTPGFEEVFVNGAFFRRNSDYTATNGSSVTLLSPLTGGDEITILAWTPFSIANQITDVNVAPNAGINSSKLNFLQRGPQTLSRTVEEKLYESVSVKDFGATGDGVTNDTISIQAALDSDHKTIYFPPGVYRLTSPLLIKNQPSSFGKMLYGNKATTYLQATPGMETIIDVLKGGDGTLSMVIKDLRFIADGAFTGWAIRALGTGTLIDSRIEGCWFSTGTLSSGSFYGKSVFSSFKDNVHELGKTFTHFTLASSTSLINNKLFSVLDPQFQIDFGNGVIIDVVNVLSHRRGALIKATGVSNLLVSNIDYQVDSTLPDSNYFCKFAELDNCTATVTNCRIISQLVSGYTTAYKVQNAVESTSSELDLSNCYFTACDTAVAYYGSLRLNINNCVVDACNYGTKFGAGATGKCSITDNTYLSLGNSPLIFQGLISAELNVEGNYVYNPWRSAAPNGICWEFNSNGSVNMANNVTKVTDNKVSYWLSVNTSHDSVLIEGNSFIGSPTVGRVAPGGSYRLGANNNGLWSLYYAASAPVSGTYLAGDRVINQAPSIGAPKGWICVISGIPGTWVSEGNL